MFYQTKASDNTRLSGGNTSDTELTLTGLTPGETYYIFVVAFGEEGTPVLPSYHSNNATILLSKFHNHNNHMYHIIIFTLINFTISCSNPTHITT